MALELPPGVDAGAVPVDQARIFNEIGTRLGLLCQNCLEPIPPPGIEAVEPREYVLVDVHFRDGKPGGSATHVIICGRKSCGEARAEARSECAGHREFSPWTIPPPRESAAEKGSDEPGDSRV